MRNSKKYIPVLISVALLGLIGLQIVWLFFVYQYKSQELIDKTQEAVLETTKHLQKEEDAEIIINNMDSLLLTDNIIGSDSKEEIRVLVSNIKDHLKTDTIKIPKGKHVERKIKIINDTNESTTVVNVGNGKTGQIIISSETSYKNDLDKYLKEFHKYVEEYQKHAKEFQRLAKESKEQTSKEKIIELQDQAKEEERIAKEFQALAKEQESLAKEAQAQEKEQSAEIKNKNLGKESPFLELEHKTLEKQKLKRKAKELQSVFFKMALSAGTAMKNIDSMFKFEKVYPILKEELVKQGIDIEPAFALYFFPDHHPAKIKYHVICGTPEFGKMLPALVNMPFYSENFYDGRIIIKIDYTSTTNFVLRQMAGLLSLSLFITLLIGFVMIYIFRRMLSQEKLHQLKNDFINNMTHELKTPIATISLALEGINNPAIKNDDEKFNNYTNILKEENKKLNNHVERVLQMALLDKGELVLDKKQINLKPVLETCIIAYQLQIQNKKAKLNFDCKVERLFVTGDEFHLLSVFNNLLDNALKYSGENCEINISLNKVGDQAEISFKDNGIGIDKNLQEKVFEKFYRAQGGNLHDVKGSGLGLSYVKSIIEAHGGTIELKSGENNGSEFIIKLKTQ